MRSPSDETLDPQLEHELRMLEAELGPDLDALQPSLEQEFARNLDAWAAEGFPGDPGALQSWRESVGSGLQRLRAKQVVLGLAGGTAIALVVATAVVVSQQGPDKATVPLQAKPGVSGLGHAQPPTTLGLPNGEAA